MADTIPHRLHHQGRTQPNSPAYYVKENGKWVATPWREYVSDVRQAAKTLIKLGLATGENICILGFNRPEWVIFDLAGMMIGAACAGIYTTNSPHEVAYIVNNAEARFILIEDLDQWAKIKAERANMPHLTHVVMMKGTEIPDDPMVHSWADFLALGADVADEDIDARMNALELDQLATLIYTSGTTGPPKGVMLSHDNLAWTASQAMTLLELTANDSTLSYLPLSHIAEQMFSIHSAVSAGYQVYFAESGLKVADNLQEVQPTTIFGVPRVWERFYNAVSARMAEAEGAKAKIAAWARKVGGEATAVRNRGQELSGLLALQFKLADKLVFSKLKPRLGLANARTMVTGAAPISTEILEFFGSLDIRILEIYGQSEDTGPTSTNRPGGIKFGTVGQVWPGAEMKIAADGEILVRGRNVFMGYYKNPEATAETLIDGWLYSGDLGQIDDEGYLSIVGRKKEIIITSGGKNIAPKNIEAALKNMPLVNDAIIIGEQRRFLTALLTLEPERLAAFAAEKGLDEHSLMGSAALSKELQDGIDSVNALFARVEHVRKFEVLPAVFSVEGGELTPTLKLKRGVIYNKYADLIETLYEG